ncbi:GNAT family N-acetyltransferase [Maritimibacter sp. HL-12]|uniref:GNAT family N-acetyltransferase n=1 Tax=Maritimibacter sp. HL-12 TaxID=1162418 RepID=UPI000A0EF49E|nr:GNAT family N-acetyltransferase [Maritimibacter sp. HL-12]SMH51333.1 phosphinothricin acetyltransferase [Maritimibacter sp. HL-12]
MIRPARPDDAAQIAAFWNPLIRDTAVTFYPLERSEAEIAASIVDKARAGHGFFVAESGGAVVGFANYGQFRTGPGYARTMEHTIIIDPRAHGTGVGRALIGAVEDHARRRGARMMIAGISGENPDGIAFHARMGYCEIARLDGVGWKFGRAMDLVLMRKTL